MFGSEQDDACDGRIPLTAVVSATKRVLAGATVGAAIAAITPEAAEMTGADPDATQLPCSGRVEGQALGTSSPRATRNARKRPRRRERATKVALSRLARDVACEVSVEVG